MDQGFIKAAAVTPLVRVADVEYNREQIEKGVEEAAAHGAKSLCFRSCAFAAIPVRIFFCRIFS